MAAQPALNLFPPVSHVEKRREELDAMIKKSLEMRPARPFIRGTSGTAAQRAASRSRSRAPAVRIPQQQLATSQTQNQNLCVQPVQQQPSSQIQSFATAVPVPTTHCQVPKIAAQPQPPQVRYDGFKASQVEGQPIKALTPPRSMTQNIPQSYHPPPAQVQRAATTPAQPPINAPTTVRTGPLPVPPIDTQNLRRSIHRNAEFRARPRRSSSARGHNRTSTASVATRASATISPASSVQSQSYSSYYKVDDSPVTNPSVYGSRPTSNVKFGSFGQNARHSAHDLPSPSIYSSKSSESLLLAAATAALPPPPPPPRSSLRPAVTSTFSPTTSPPRQPRSQTNHRQQESNASSVSFNGRRLTQDSFASYQVPTSLSRSNTLTEVGSPESYYLPEKPVWTSTMDNSIRSMFPTYDHDAQQQSQRYHPSRSAPVVPRAFMKHDSTSTTSHSASNSTAHSSILGHSARSTPVAVSTTHELNSLWNASNGQITAALPGPFNLRMFKSAMESKRRSKISFGPNELETFYSLAQAHPADNNEDEAHEALIFRHHASTEDCKEPTADDLLPISHMLVYSPPAPSYFTASRHSINPAPAKEAEPISTVTPVMATLHALEAAAKSPQAHAMATNDPKAESPAAARLAERAVQAASQRESCALSWTRAGSHAGKYELHHPSLGVFAVVVEGDVKMALSSISSNTKSRKHASITLLNPFASLSYKSPQMGTLSPIAASFADSKPAPQGILARLDFTEEILHIDGPAIQSLGNVYLLDVAVSTVLAVAIAESQRADDPGLIFAAPPPSLMLTKTKKTSRLFSSYSSPSDQVGTTSQDKKKKKLTSASTVSLVQLVRGTNGNSGGMSSNAKRENVAKRTIDWSRTNAILGIEHLIDVNDLPRITRGILSVLGLAFKTALWLLEFGVRISAKMVIGLTKFADKV